MKPIQVRPTIIDIPFEDSNGNEILRLQFDRSDSNINKFYDAIPDMVSKIQEVEQQVDAGKEESEIDFDADQFTKKLADSFLGEGAYEKIYALNNSTFMTAKYILQIAIGIKEEMEEEDKRAVFDKYK